MTPTAVATKFLPATFTEVPRTENYEVRDYREFETASGTLHMVGELYREDVHVATIEDRSDGGMVWVNYNHELDDDDSFHAERQRFEDWATIFPNDNLAPATDYRDEVAASNAAGALLVETGTFLELKRRRRLTVAVSEFAVKTADHKVFKTGVKIETHKDALVQKFGEGAMFWNRKLGVWSIIKNA